MARELKVKASRIRVLFNDITLNFMEGSHEMELPEGGDTKAPGGFFYSLWSLSCFPFTKPKKSKLTLKEVQDVLSK